MKRWLRNTQVNADAWLDNCRALSRIFLVLLGIAGAASAFSTISAVLMTTGRLPYDPFPLGADVIVFAMACLLSALIFGRSTLSSASFASGRTAATQTVPS